MQLQHAFVGSGAEEGGNHDLRQPNLATELAWVGTSSQAFDVELDGSNACVKGRRNNDWLCLGNVHSKHF